MDSTAPPRHHAPPVAQSPAVPAVVDRRPSVLWPALFSGGLVQLNYLYLLPPAPQAVLRDWGLHWLAVMFTGILTAQLLGLSTATRAADARRIVFLATLLPVLVFGGHETMQWFYPDHGVRDDFDSIRDYALNAVGATASWLSLRWCRPRRARPSWRRRPSGRAT